MFINLHLFLFENSQNLIRGIIKLSPSTDGLTIKLQYRLSNITECIVPLHASITDRNIPQSVQKLYRRSNEVMSDFKSLSRNVKSQLFSTFCLDAYGSQLWLFFNNSVKLYYTAWRKVIRKAWCLPFTTHCRFLHTINNSLPIDVQLEKICLKFVHSCLNSSNEVVKSISLSSIQQSFSTFGENYRYLCHKYKIMPYMFRSDFPHYNKTNTFICG